MKLEELAKKEETRFEKKDFTNTDYVSEESE